MSALPLTGELSPAALLRKKFHELKQSRIRIVPVHTTRASSVGNPCSRFLFYERTAGEMRTPHGEELQAIFDLGNQVEKFVVRELSEMGFEVLQRDRDYHDRALELTGHLDGMLRFGDQLVPIEIKGLNPHTAEKIDTLADIRDSRTAWVKKYYAQLQAYLHLSGHKLGLFVLLNKSTGLISFIECPYDAEFSRELIAKVEGVRDAVKSGTPPERHRTSDCVRCPFRHVCLPDIDFGPGVEIVDEAELILALEKREALRDAKRDFDAADRTVKALLPKTAKAMLVGQFQVTGKEVKRKGYTVPDVTFVQWDVEEVSGEAAKAAALAARAAAVPYAPPALTEGLPAPWRPKVVAAPSPSPTTKKAKVEDEF